MKKCPACGIQYQDTQGFCSKCGAKLVSATPVFEPINPLPEDKKHLDPSDWGGAVLALVGLLIGWHEDALLGVVFAIVGIFYGRQSRNTLFRIAAYVLGGITLLLALIFFLVV